MQVFEGWPLRILDKTSWNKTFNSMATIWVSDDHGDEEALQWAALERLPTFESLRTSVLRFDGESGQERTKLVDVTKLRVEDRQQLIEKIVRDTETEDDNRFLRKFRERVDRVGIDLPKIEIRYQDLKVEAESQQGSRATPSLPNFFRSVVKLPWRILGLGKKVKTTILSDVSGIVKPTRLTLLLGPPGSGRTSFLRALAGRLSNDLKVFGEVTYNGHHMREFIPRKTSAYVSQYDLQTAELTVRETLGFYNRVQGVGNRNDLLTELAGREKELRIVPDADVDIYLKATAVPAQSANLGVDYILKIMGLDICADTPIGDALRRGISGGQKKRVTTAEMLVGPAKVFLMDEISTGLDSSTTFQITKMLRDIAHLMDNTIVVSLLQPPPETYDLFDDLILLADGQILYQGPCSSVLEFMAYMGFRCPERKATADFLQEVTSPKDQEQYWANKAVPYAQVPVSAFVEGFKRFHVGQSLENELAIPYDKSKSHPTALVYDKYALSNSELLRACFAREFILMKRNMKTYVAKMIQLALIASITATVFLRTRMHHNTINNATVYLGALFFTLMFIMTAVFPELTFITLRLPVYYKEKELFLYPAWALTIPMILLRIPWTILEAGVFLTVVYYVIGFSPGPGRFFTLFLVLILINQATIAICRFSAAVGKTRVAADNMGSAIYVATVLLGGFLLSRDNMPVWWKWASWCSILFYSQEAVSVNEYLSKEWEKPFNTSVTLGEAVLQTRGLETGHNWVWISIGALFGFAILFNTVFILCFQYLDQPPIRRSGALKSPENGEEGLQKGGPAAIAPSNAYDETGQSLPRDAIAISSAEDTDGVPRGGKGSVLPVQSLSMAFNKINYYVDIPKAMKEHVTEEKLQLLRNVTGAFLPGVLTALVGVSGAGKTTLLDVLAGRKTRGHVEGQIFISGHPKAQSTFTRIAGYCEQNDIHSPNLTVLESLLFSAWMRLSPEVDRQTSTMFVNHVMNLVELDVIREFVVGLPGVSGLSTEQRKRLTIAVELVANPSIIFMDEPTSGLDARAAAIVMRAVRNIGDTGRTVVCTIHQPSIDIFEAFDELLLLKPGGETIYAGPLGRYSRHMIEYFEAIPGVPKIKDGYNPATWMMEFSSTSMESTLEVNFPDIYAKSDAYLKNEAVVKNVSIPAPGSKDLQFPTVYAQSFWVQFQAGLWKMSMSYWRNTTYTGVKLLFTTLLGLFVGSLFWGLGKKRDTQQDVFNLMGAIYGTVFFIGWNSAMTVQSVVGSERIVYYRERGAGMYSPLTYALAQFLIEWPYNLVQALLYTGIVYSMIQFEWEPAKFFWFLFFMFFTLLFFVYYGMICVAVTSNAMGAAILSSSLFSLFNLFTGFVITRKQMPAWWRWFYWCTPSAWSIYGLFVSQLGDVETFTALPDNPNGHITVKEYLSDYYGYDYSFLKYVAIEQVMIAVCSALLFAFIIKYYNVQQR